jgi:DNA-binding response OmpR family regulator
MIVLASTRIATFRSVVESLRGAGLPIALAANVSGALSIAGTECPSVIVCDGDLPGGGWRALLSASRDLSSPPLLVVSSPLADDLFWQDVLNRGGFDVLVEPFDLAEVSRIVLAADRNWRRKALHRLPLYGQQPGD